MELRLLSNQSTALRLSFIWVMKSMPRTRAADRNVVSMKDGDLDEEYLQRKVTFISSFPLEITPFCLIRRALKR